MSVQTSLGPLDVVVLDYGGTIAPDGPKDIAEEQRVDMPLFPDAARVIRTLHKAGLRVVVASNTAGQETRRPMLEQAGIADLVEAVLISSQLGVAKPESGFYQAILNQALCPADRIVHVGNRWDYDVLCPLQFMMKSVWVYPFAGRSRSVRGIPIITGIEQLPSRLFRRYGIRLPYRALRM